MSIQDQIQLDDLTLLGTSKAPSQKKLETFSAPANLYNVSFKTDEFTSVCPITGQPDFAEIFIRYSPKEKCLESKSLKLYLQTFRNEGAFNEALTAQIAQDLYEVLEPIEISVTIHQKARGGISLSSTCILPPYPGSPR